MLTYENECSVQGIIVNKLHSTMKRPTRTNTNSGMRLATMRSSPQDLSFLDLSFLARVMMLPHGSSGLMSTKSEISMANNPTSSWNHTRVSGVTLIKRFTLISTDELSLAEEAMVRMDS